MKPSISGHSEGAFGDVGPEGNAWEIDDGDQRTRLSYVTAYVPKPTVDPEVTVVGRVE